MGGTAALPTNTLTMENAMQTKVIEQKDGQIEWPTLAERSEWPTVIHRFPRKEETNTDKVEKLVTETRQLMKGLAPAKKLYRDVQIAVGRSLIALQRALRRAGKLRHGQWQNFYEKTFAGGPVSLHSAQKYMRFARNDIEKGKKGPESFLIGKDPEIDKAAEEHRQAVETALRAKPPSFLSIRLHFCDQAERNDMDQFWKSDKQLLEQQTVDLWRKLRHVRRAS